MCVAFILYNCLSKYIFVLAFNRDEVLERDARSAHWWDDQEGVVGGRDCVGGGTWMCATVDGRIAFVTNFRKRQDGNLTSSAPSRGALPLNFVASGDSPAAYLSKINGAEYTGFNLVVADLANPPQEGTISNSQVYYLTNAAFLGDDEAPAGPIPLPPGVHGVSNAVLDTPWPKVALGRRRFEDLAGSGAFNGAEFPWDEMFAVMRDPKVLETDPRKLPETGYGAEFESAASALFMEPLELEGFGFGTRSVTVLAVPRDGSPAELREQYLTNDGGWAEERHRFDMKLAAHIPGPD